MIIKEMWFFLARGKSGKVCKWSGKGVGVVKVCEKSAAKFIFW